MELIAILSFYALRSRRIMFDVFISMESSFLVGRKLVPIPRQHTTMLLGQDKLSYLIDWHRLTLVLYENHIASRPGGGVGVGLSSLYRQGFSRRGSTGLVRIDPGD